MDDVPAVRRAARRRRLLRYRAVLASVAHDPIFYPTASRRDGNPLIRVGDELRSRLARPRGPASGPAWIRRGLHPDLAGRPTAG